MLTTSNVEYQGKIREFNIYRYDYDSFLNSIFSVVNDVNRDSVVILKDQKIIDYDNFEKNIFSGNNLYKMVDKKDIDKSYLEKDIILRMKYHDDIKIKLLRYDTVKDILRKISEELVLPLGCFQLFDLKEDEIDEESFDYYEFEDGYVIQSATETIKNIKLLNQKYSLYMEENKLEKAKKTHLKLDKLIEYL